MEVRETVSQDRIRQWTVEQVVDASVPQAEEELADVFRVFSQDRIQQRIVEQIIPVIPLAEKIVELLVIQTRQSVNEWVQHVVNTVEVEKYKIIEETVQRMEPIIKEKINQATKHIKIPQVQFLNKADDKPVVVQRQVPMTQTVRKTVEVPPLQFTDKVVDVPVVAQRQIPIAVQTIQKTKDIPQLQCINKVIDVPVVSVAQAPHVQIVEKTVESPQLQIVKETAKIPETQMIQGTQTSESLGKVPVSENPLARFIDRVVDVPVMAQRPGPSRKKELEGSSSNC